MKRLLALLLSFCLIFSLAACGKAETEEKPESQPTAKGNEALTLIEEGKYKEAYELLVNKNDDESKKLLEKFTVKYEKAEVIGSNENYTYDIKYDKYGNMTSYVIHRETEEETYTATYVYEHEYDGSGNIVSEKVDTTEEYIIAGESTKFDQTFLHEYRYNEKGILVWENEDGFVTEYDDFGNMINNNGWEIINEYDDSERLTRSLAKNSGQYTLYEYDPAGNLVKKSSYDAYGGLQGNTEYEYNTDGFLIKETSVYDGEKTEYEYDKQGKITLEVYYNEDGSLDSREEYKYDEFGNEILYTHYEADGSIAEKSETKYTSPVYFYFDK